ncbi:unnamed protein product [Ixodes hexagonus]
MLTLENFINGKFEPHAETIENVDPSTGLVYCRLPNSGSREVEKAVQAATQAFTSWSIKSPAERSKFLIRIADLIESRLDEFSQAESRDQGKPVWLARTVDIPRAVHNFRHFATTAQCDREMAIPQQTSSVLHYTVRTAVGVVAVITPWNLPLYLLTFKLAPAMVYGNTVVAKPSELTSVTAWLLAKVFVDAGGKTCLRCIQYQASLTYHTSVDDTDEPQLAYIYAPMRASALQKVAEGYVGKAAFRGRTDQFAIKAHDDHDPPPPILQAGVREQSPDGACETRASEVARAVVSPANDYWPWQRRKLKVGPPQSESVFMGALVSKEHLEKVKFYIKLAMEDGGKVLCGGLREEPDVPKENKNGYFLLPTVIVDLPQTSRCMQEEIFGPVTCLAPFESEQEAVEKVNGVCYGLCASIWSRDVSRIHKMAQRLEARSESLDVGTIWCNCWMVRHLHMPFGGMKMSGVGREGTDASKEFYTEVKSICLDYS